MSVCVCLPALRAPLNFSKKRSGADLTRVKFTVVTVKRISLGRLIILIVLIQHIVSPPASPEGEADGGQAASRQHQAMESFKDNTNRIIIKSTNKFLITDQGLTPIVFVRRLLAGMAPP